MLGDAISSSSEIVGAGSMGHLQGEAGPGTGAGEPGAVVLAVLIAKTPLGALVSVRARAREAFVQFVALRACTLTAYRR
jgi:hypothetical protein